MRKFFSDPGRVFSILLNFLDRTAGESLDHRVVPEEIRVHSTCRDYCLDAISRCCCCCRPLCRRTSKLDFTIDTEFLNITPKFLEDFEQEVATKAECNPGDVLITRVRNGSVIYTLRLPTPAARVIEKEKESFMTHFNKQSQHKIKNIQRTPMDIKIVGASPLAPWSALALVFALGWSYSPPVTSYVIMLGFIYQLRRLAIKQTERVDFGRHLYQCYNISLQIMMHIQVLV